MGAADTSQGEGETKPRGDTPSTPRRHAVIGGLQFKIQIIEIRGLVFGQGFAFLFRFPRLLRLL